MNKKTPTLDELIGRLKAVRIIPPEQPHELVKKTSGEPLIITPKMRREAALRDKGLPPDSR